VYAHFLVPTGLVAIATRVPYVITAHGADVRNMRRSPVVAALTKQVLRRAAAVICVSEYVSRQLSAPAGMKVEVIDCGVDTERLKPAPRAEGNGTGPRFLYIGSLTHRKNVERLQQAFAKLGGGTLTIVGGGPLEERLRETAPVGTRFAGRLSSDGVAAEIAKADVICPPRSSRRRSARWSIRSTSTRSPPGCWPRRRCRCRPRRPCRRRPRTRSRSRPRRSRPSSPAPPTALRRSRQAGSDPEAAPVSIRKRFVTPGDLWTCPGPAMVSG